MRTKLIDYTLLISVVVYVYSILHDECACFVTECSHTHTTHSAQQLYCLHVIIFQNESNVKTHFNEH